MDCIHLFYCVSNLDDVVYTSYYFTMPVCLDFFFGKHSSMDTSKTNPACLHIVVNKNYGRLKSPY